MEGFLQRLRTSLHKGRGVSLPPDRKAALNLLLNTIFADDVSTLEDLLTSSGFDVNTIFHRAKRTLILSCAQANAYDCLSLLIKKGADVNQADVSGTTAFLAACRNGHRRIVKKLISLKELDISCKDMSGLTGVHWMAASGRSECLLDSVSHIKNIDMLDAQGQTALHVASKNGHIKSMELLIDHKADINKAANSGDTPLHFACSNGQLPGLQLLLAKGAVYKANNKCQYPIEMAVEGEHVGVVSLLVESNRELVTPLTQLTILDRVDEKKILTVLQEVTKRHECKEEVLNVLADMATNAGLKLLTAFSILDVELFALMRCINVLSGLCKHATAQEIRLIQQPLADVWSSMEGWFNLLSEKMKLLPPEEYSDCKISTGEDDCLRHTSDTAAAINAANAMTASTTSTCSQSSSSSDKSSSSTRHRDIELHTICPRISCVIQAFYFVSLLGHEQQETIPDSFLQFIEAHEKEVEFLIKRNPNDLFYNFDFLMTSSRLNIRFFKFIKIQPFSARKDWFHKNLEERSNGVIYSPGSMEDMLVARDSLFTSSCHQLLRRDPSDLKKNLAVRFAGEDGMGPGVLRDWFDALSQELLNPDYALFTVSPDGATFQPNPMSYVNPDHLNYFNFAGQIIGLALYHRQLVSVYFTRSFYKHILGIPVSCRDVESIDPEYFKNLQWILDNDITDLGLDLTFVVETNNFGAQQLTELKPGGAKIPVTDKNKNEYVQLVTELKMTRSIRPQIHSFLQGFHKFIPETALKIFDEYELEILLSGLPDVDMDDWKKNTEYIGYSPSDPTILWFWEILDDMEREEKVQILQFTTGSSRVPFGGFCHLRGGEAEQKFTISQVISSGSQRLPSASTCVNMLKLPVYENKETLHKCLKISLDNCTGFGVA